MYSSKQNVNILTSLLVAHGVRYAVVCPGSRNSPIVHNLNECPEIECYPVTDERSAGFYALGIAQVVHRPVVVCVTSGTALLNLAPAVAEAYYQHMPLVVISADRPEQWIDQLDGQTLPQPDALGRFVKKAVNLPEVYNDEMHWYCNRLVNEAMNETTHHGNGPVHINVPISEPLFEYDVEQLPEERVIQLLPPRSNQALIALECAGQFAVAKKPMVVIGQLSTGELIPQELFMLSQCAVVVHEALSVGNGSTNFDEVIHVLGDNPAYQPDFVLYVGDTLVSKRLKKWLRGLKDVYIWAVTEDGSIHDTSMQLYGVIEGSPADVIEDLVDAVRYKAISSTATFKARWDQATRLAAYRAMKFQPEYSQMATVKYLEEKLGKAIYRYIHYGNSSPIRMANIFARHYVFCNRGVNGIDGSLSTAAGCSIVTGDEKVLCVLGDLSFFYDQNALWNQNLNGNLHIIVLNNGKGAIFNLLKGLEQSPARDKYVAAQHQTTAQGICKQNNIRYMKATNMEEMQKGIDTLLNKKSTRPVLLEVFTDSEEDERVIKSYYQILKNEKLANDKRV